MAGRRLSAADRAWLARVADAAFANPFSAERERIDRELAEATGRGAEVVDRLAARLRARLLRIGEGRMPALGRFAPKDREVLEHAILFDVFHRFLPALDAAIDAQLEAGDAPRPVPFAGDLLGALTSAGIDDARAVRMLELFWQMRRAWTFVGQRLVGGSPSMRRVREALWNAVFTCDIRRYDQHLWNRMEDFSTLILGPTGTGKEAAARAIGLSGFLPFDAHRRRFAQSFTGTFTPLNLAQFAEGLLESELFGHRKGAFTGAIDSYEGVLARSGRHGTVFLDEVAEIGQAAQVKLLRVLQEREYSPVGGRERRRFEGRIVAATHRDVGARREEGLFRDDFYYRLSAYVIGMPSLRARLDEHPPELEELLAAVVARIVGRPDAGLVGDVLEALARDLPPRYEWPGNVRELEHAVRRVLLTGAAAPDARRGASATGPGALADVLARGELRADDVVARYCAMLYDRLGSYEAVGRVAGLDRRTARRHVLAARAQGA